MKNIVLITLALALFGAACIVFAKTTVPAVCRNIDGAMLCLVSQDNLETLIKAYDDMVIKAKNASCKNLSEV